MLLEYPSVCPRRGGPLEEVHTRYDPYGRRHIYDGGGGLLTQSKVGNPYGFTGRRHDQETGLIYYRNRYYSPEIGRFLTYDPVGIWWDKGEVGNGFSFSINNPYTNSDPLGFSPPKMTTMDWITVGVVAVGAIGGFMWGGLFGSKKGVEAAGCFLAVTAGVISETGIVDTKKSFWKLWENIKEGPENYHPMNKVDCCREVRAMFVLTGG